jgi:hypothetical protein
MSMYAWMCMKVSRIWHDYYLHGSSRTYIHTDKNRRTNSLSSLSLSLSHSLTYISTHAHTFQPGIISAQKGICSMDVHHLCIDVCKDFWHIPLWLQTHSQTGALARCTPWKSRPACASSDLSGENPWFPASMYACMHVHTQVCMHIHNIYAYICMYVSIFISLGLHALLQTFGKRIHDFLQVCIYVCIFIHIHNSSIYLHIYHSCVCLALVTQTCVYICTHTHTYSHLVAIYSSNNHTKQWECVILGRVSTKTHTWWLYTHTWWLYTHAHMMAIYTCMW